MENRNQFCVTKKYDKMNLNAFILKNHLIARSYIKNLIHFIYNPMKEFWRPLCACNASVQPYTEEKPLAEMNVSREKRIQYPRKYRILFD